MIFYILMIPLIILLIYLIFWGDKLFPDKRVQQAETGAVTLEELANKLWLKRERELEDELASKTKESIITLDPVVPVEAVPEPEQPTPKESPTPAKPKPDVPAQQVDQEVSSLVPEIPHAENNKWNHQELIDFENNFVSQYRNIIAQSQHIIPLQKVMEILDTYGDQPSIVSMNDDDEYKILGSHYATFTQITLLQHSLNVVYELGKIIEESGSRDAKYSMGKYILMCLGHDIGKITEFLSSDYITGNHPIISAGKMMGILPPGTPGRDDIINAIRNHHVRSAKNKSTILLRQADSRAREYEAESVSVEKAVLVRDLLTDDPNPEATKIKKKPKITEAVDLSWVDWDDVISKIDENINVPNENKWVNAISVSDGYIYIKPVLINKIIWQQAKEKEITEFTVYSIKDRERSDAVSNSVANYFRDQYAISETINRPYFTRKFKLVDKDNNVVRSGFYTAIKAEMFKTPLDELEERKLNLEWLMKIKNVIPG